MAGSNDYIPESNYNPFPYIMKGLSDLREGFNNTDNEEKLLENTIKVKQLKQQEKKSEDQDTANEAAAQVISKSHAFRDPAVSAAIMKTGNVPTEAAYKPTPTVSMKDMNDRMASDLILNKIPALTMSLGTPGDHSAQQATLQKYNDWLVDFGYYDKRKNATKSVLQQVKSQYGTGQDFDDAVSDVDKNMENYVKPGLISMHGDQIGNEMYNNLKSSGYYDQMYSNMRSTPNAWKNAIDQFTQITPTELGVISPKLSQFEQHVSGMNLDDLNKLVKDPTLPPWEKDFVGEALVFQAHAQPTTDKTGTFYKKPTFADITAMAQHAQNPVGDILKSQYKSNTDLQQIRNNAGLQKDPNWEQTLTNNASSQNAQESDKDLYNKYSTIKKGQKNQTQAFFDRLKANAAASQGKGNDQGGIISTPMGSGIQNPNAITAQGVGGQQSSLNPQGNTINQATDQGSENETDEEQ